MQDIDYRALRQQVQKDLQRQKSLTRWVLFVVNLFLYILFVILGWGMFLSVGGVPQQESLIGAMIMMTTIGGLSLMFQFISAMLDTKSAEMQMRQQIMSKLMANEVMRLGEDDEMQEDEKAKRSLRLTDEGELDEVLSDAEIAALDAQRRRQQRG